MLAERYSANHGGGQKKRGEEDKEGKDKGRNSVYLKTFSAVLYILRMRLFDVCFLVSLRHLRYFKCYKTDIVGLWDFLR